MTRIVFLLISLAAWCASAVAEPLLLRADRAFKLAKSGEILLLDIRSPQEWQQTGVPRGAVALTMQTSKDVFYRRVLAAVGRDKTKPIAVICAAGNRSRLASNFLTQRGFSRVANVGEGLFGNRKQPGWLARGLPVQKP